MPITVHHRPVDPTHTYTIHAWDGTSTWDLPGTQHGEVVDYPLSEVHDPRKLRFMFHPFDRETHKDSFEPDDFIRRVRLADITDIWSYDYSARILYENPAESGISFHAGDVLTFNVVTQG